VQLINRRRVTRIASLAVGIAIILGFIYFVGLDSLARVLLQVNPAVVIVMVAIQLLGFTFYATAWYLLIRAAGYRLPFLTCEGITFASIFASNTMPSGVFLEVVRCILGSKESGMRLGESTATVILHRVLYVFGFLACTALALVALVIGGRVRTPVVLELAAVPVLAVVALVVLLYISLHPKKMQPLLERALKLAQPLVKLIQKEARMDGKAGQFSGDYHASFRRMLSSTTHIAASFGASLGDWACSVLLLWIVLAALGSFVSLWIVMVTIAIGKMIQMTPIGVPGMLGIYETAITTSLSLFGTSVAVAASAALLSRIVTFWLDLPITGIAAYHYGYKLVGKQAFSTRA
jgi:uncharacterized protein (TIRG00374 family)